MGIKYWKFRAQYRRLRSDSPDSMSGGLWRPHMWTPTNSSTIRPIDMEIDAIQCVCSFERLKSSLCALPSCYVILNGPTHFIEVDLYAVQLDLSQFPSWRNGFALCHHRLLFQILTIEKFVKWKRVLDEARLCLHQHCSRYDAKMAKNVNFLSVLCANDKMIASLPFAIYHQIECGLFEGVGVLLIFAHHK